MRRPSELNARLSIPRAGNRPSSRVIFRPRSKTYSCGPAGHGHATTIGADDKLACSAAPQLSGRLAPVGFMRLFRQSQMLTRLVSDSRHRALDFVATPRGDEERAICQEREPAHVVPGYRRLPDAASPIAAIFRGPGRLGSLLVRESCRPQNQSTVGLIAMWSRYLSGPIARALQSGSTVFSRGSAALSADPLSTFAGDRHGVGLRGKQGIVIGAHRKSARDAVVDGGAGRRQSFAGPRNATPSILRFARKSRSPTRRRWRPARCWPSRRPNCGNRMTPTVRPGRPIPRPHFTGGVGQSTAIGGHHTPTTVAR